MIQGISGRLCTAGVSDRPKQAGVSKPLPRNGVSKRIFRAAVSVAAGVLISAGAPGAINVSAAFACPCDKYDKPVPEPKDIGTKIGMEYARTAQYKREFADAIASAKKACLAYLKEHPQANNMAIVSDIDETLLDNREHFATMDEFEWKAFVKWVERSSAPSLKPTADFLKWARKKGFAIFLVTGRPETLRAATMRNLVRNDIAYDALYLRGKDDRRSAIEVKTAVRKEIEDMGFKIVVNLGDQVSDLIGGHSIDCEKLPNKLYFVD